jgi:hypothetical protein
MLSFRASRRASLREAHFLFLAWPSGRAPWLLGRPFFIPDEPRSCVEPCPSRQPEKIRTSNRDAVRIFVFLSFKRRVPLEGAAYQGTPSVGIISGCWCMAIPSVRVPGAP